MVIYKPSFNLLNHLNKLDFLDFSDISIVRHLVKLICFSSVYILF